jgi:sulfide:quinone oxidoreductase
VIAGGGVAGLETLMGLRALAGDRVKLTLVAPHDEFVYRPLVVEEGFAAGRMRRVPLSRAADDAGGRLRRRDHRGCRSRAGPAGSSR